jgi:ribulose-phosphate 3-epimerase
MPVLVAPSVLSADFGHLADDINFINTSPADWFHVDIMDGVFVPNISFGFPVMKALQKDAKKPLDFHLMIADADKYLEEFAMHGAYMLTVHYEACTHLHRTIQKIKSLNMKAGVAINPHTSVSVLENVLADLDLVLVMSVNPGFGGQKFIPQTIAKVKALRKMIDEQGLKTLIEVDGGVDTSNARALEEAGANVLVAGNAVFSAKDRNATIKLIQG